MFTQTRDRLRLDLDAGQRRHTIKEHRNGRGIGDRGVVTDECFLSNCRAIEVWRDNQDGIRSGSMCLFYFIDRAESTLLPGPDDECSIIWHRRARSFDQLKILTVVEMNSLTRRPQQHVTNDAGVVPPRQIRTQRIEHKLAVSSKGSSDR